MASNMSTYFGYNEEGYDEEYYNRDGYNVEGYDRDGYNRDGYNKLGYDRYGYKCPDLNCMPPSDETEKSVLAQDLPVTRDDNLNFILNLEFYRKKTKPPGWKEEKVKRLNGILKGYEDKFYYEPGTNRRFRSRKTAWKQYDKTMRQ